MIECIIIISKKNKTKLSSYNFIEIECILNFLKIKLITIKIVDHTSLLQEANFNIFNNFIYSTKCKRAESNNSSNVVNHI